MSSWETVLSVRDGVFAQVFILTLLALVIYRLLLAPHPRRRWLAHRAALLLFVVLSLASLANIILWTP